jgi:hypothetical protein
MHTLWPPFLASAVIAFVITATGQYWYPYVVGEDNE